MTFHRLKLASDMADQLLQPKGLMKKVRSGLFLGGLRRIGKTTFLRGDLIPGWRQLACPACQRAQAGCRQLVVDCTIYPQS